MDGTCFVNSNSPATKYSTAKSHAIKYSKENERHKQNDHFFQPGMAKKSHTKSAAQSIKKDGTRKYLKMDATDSKSINESQNLWYILLRASTQHANKLRHQDRPKCRQIALRRGGEMVPNEGNERGMGRINTATNHGVWIGGIKVGIRCQLW